MRHADDERQLDGNAAAGLLRELFAFEATSAIAVCSGCERASPIGTLLLYAQQLGAVLRCPGCTQVMIVVTKPRGEWWLDLAGVRVMRVPAQS